MVDTYSNIQTFAHNNFNFFQIELFRTIVLFTEERVFVGTFSREKYLYNLV